jgi:hypothetical protein
MSPDAAARFDLIINCIGLLGVVLLAIPALFVNSYGRMLAKLAKLDGPTVMQNPALQRARRDLAAAIHRKQGDWTPLKGGLLVGGTALAGLSYLLGIIKAWLS